MENMNKEKKFEQKIAAGTFGTCNYARLSDQYCVKYEFYPLSKYGRDHWERYCMSYGNCDSFF